MMKLPWKALEFLTLAQTTLCISSPFYPGFYSCGWGGGGVGQVKGHVSLEMFTNGKDLGSTKAT